jgi:hypothetical protein
MRSMNGQEKTIVWYKNSPGWSRRRLGWPDVMRPMTVTSPCKRRVNLIGEER